MAITYHPVPTELTFDKPETPIQVRLDGKVTGLIRKATGGFAYYPKGAGGSKNKGETFATIEEVKRSLENGDPDYSQTYWSHKGEHEALLEALNKLVPPQGSVQNPDENPALETFRIASNAYYDMYNNGFGNRDDDFRKAFGFDGPQMYYDAGGADRGELTQELIDLTEATMDAIALAAGKEQGLKENGEFETVQDIIDEHQPTAYQRIDAKVESTVQQLATAVDRAEAKTGHKLTITEAPTPQLVDVTPEALKTPEGVKRAEQAQKEWDDATHEIANTLKRIIDDIFDPHIDKVARAEYYSELQTLLGIRDAKQDAFIRAVTGR